MEKRIPESITKVDGTVIDIRITPKGHIYYRVFFMGIADNFTRTSITQVLAWEDDAVQEWEEEVSK
jgi:hypothetical protein